MRHGKKFNHLGRNSSHRKSLLSNMATSLILNKSVTTTVAKARELRKYVEPLISKAKNNTTHSRRVVFSYLGNKHSIIELFGDIAEKVSDRPGGYTRILKIGNRLGDNAEMAVIELVDYNEYMLAAKAEKGAAKTKTRRSRRGAGTGVAAETKKVEAKAPVKEVETTENIVEETTTDETAAEENKD